MQAATVLWMLTILCSLLAHFGAVAAWIAASIWPDRIGQTARLATGGLLLAALVCGILCLALTPLVWWLRPDKPPLTIVVVAVVAGMTPIVTLIFLNWLA